MATEDSFLQAISDEPDDDTNRLVYADWLDDHGQPERAEFIRVQIKLTRLSGDDPQRDALEARERALLEEHREQWAAPLRAWVSVDEFRRGLVEAVTARPEAFLEHAAVLFQAAPVRSVRFQTAMFQLGVPHLVHPSSGPLMPRLAACPFLARLSAMYFWMNHIGDVGVETLATSPHLARLASLDLTINDVGNRGAQALAESPAFSRLVSLVLHSNSIGREGGQALARSPHLAGLTSLDLGENPLGDDGVVALASSPGLCNLETLGLARTGLGSAAARALAASPHLTRLKSLDVRDNIIGNKVRAALRLRFGKGRCRF
jgi:uncharacterized protein (TIGR02996 family)